ncbi:MAG: sugar phosphate nucleotidyltransferase [Sphingomonadales bacterium]
MQAVILAAGTGSRLAPLTDKLPKGLLEVGGTPLLGHSLNCLERAGVNEIILIIGHRGDLIRAAFGERHNGVAIRYAENPDYGATGSMVSLLAARPLVRPEPFLVLESDLLYHPDFITIARRLPGPSLLAADISGSGDEVYLHADADGRLCYLGKTRNERSMGDCVGEFAGISQLTPGFYDLFCDLAHQSSDHSRHYEELLFDLAKAGETLKVRPCPGLAWTEVDNVADLERAQTRVWPRIMRS